MDKIIFISVMAILGQILFASIFNTFNGTKIPESIPEFLKLICLPYIILNSKKIKNK